MPGSAPPTIDAALVGRLVCAQFPELAALPIKAIAGGWDHRSFRLGDALSVRLPSAAIYAPQVIREHHWLPFLAARLAVPLPRPVALGEPTHDYPWHWAIRGWCAGDAAADQPLTDSLQFARDVGAFVAALHRIEPATGPAPGLDNFHRGGPLSHYADQVTTALARWPDAHEHERCEAIFAAAIAARQSGAPRWLHGDLLPGNLLVAEDRLSAVIDFGLMAVGDPACDLMIAWSYFRGAARAAFLDAAGADPGMIARSRGWALWKAVIILAGVTPRPPREVAWARAMLGAVLAG